MTTRREDIRDAIKTALEDIDTSNTYQIDGAAKSYLTDIETVEYVGEAPEQVDDSERPALRFKQRGSEDPALEPWFQERITTPWRVYCYPNVDGDWSDLRTAANALMDDVKHALYKDIRLCNGCVSGDGQVTFLRITGRDTDEGQLTEQGFCLLDFETIHHQRTDE